MAQAAQHGRWRVLTGSAVSMVLLCLAATGGLVPSDQTWFRILVRTVLGAGGLGAAAWTIGAQAARTRETLGQRLVRQARAAAQPAAGTIEKPARTLLTEAGAHALADPTDPALASLVWAVTDPVDARRKITERVTLDERSLTRTTTVQFVVRDVGQGPLYIPLLNPDKGELTESLDVRDTAGSRVPVLSRKDTNGLVWGMVRSLVQQASAGSASAQESHTLGALESWYGAVAILPRHTTDALAEPDAPTTADPTAALALTQLEAIRQELESRYLVVAVVDQGVGTTVGSDRYVELTYSITHPQSSQHAPSADRPVKSWLRNTAARAMLVAETQFEFDAGRALRCGDYYLTVEAPSHSMVGDAIFCNGTFAQPIVKVEDARGKVTAFHHRTPPPRDQAEATLYTRDLNRGPHRHPIYYVSFFEKLPGTLGRAVVAAWGLTWVVWATGLLLGSAAVAGDADDLAFVLTAQGGLLAWLVAAGRRPTTVRSLTSRLSLAATGFLSALAAILFVTHMTGRLPSSHAEEISFWFLDDWSWMAVMLLTFVNAVYITCTLLVRERRSRWLRTQ